MRDLANLENDSTSLSKSFDRRNCFRRRCSENARFICGQWCHGGTEGGWGRHNFSKQVLPRLFEFWSKGWCVGCGLKLSLSTCIASLKQLSVSWSRLSWSQNDSHAKRWYAGMAIQTWREVTSSTSSGSAGKLGPCLLCYARVVKKNAGSAAFLLVLSGPLL